MTEMDDFEQSLAGWLSDEAPDQAPDRVLDGALQRAARQPQRRGWFDGLFRMRLGPVARISVVLAVIAAAAFIGFQFANLTPGPGGPPSPLPSPSSTELPTPSATPTPSPTVSPGPTGAERTPSAECINPPVDIVTLVYQSDPVACYGSASLTLDAYMTRVGAIDGPCLMIEPTWFACGSWIQLQPVRETAAASVVLAFAPSDPEAPFFFAAIHPTAGTPDALPFGGSFGINVRITGHFEDPAAQSCRFAGDGVYGGEQYTAADAIESCRSTFVLTGIVPLP